MALLWESDILSDMTNPALLLDPSDVSSVISNESFQMVGPEQMSDRDVGDLVMVDNGEPSSFDDEMSSSTLRKTTRHHKTGLCFDSCQLSSIL